MDRLASSASRPITGTLRWMISTSGVAMPSWRCLFAVPPPRHGVEAFLLLIARI
ncbi:TPA: DoxX family protein, partial [Stenotrophomonas maltophilia]